MRMNRKPGYGAQLRANLEPTKGVGRLRQQGRWSWKSKSHPAKECEGVAVAVKPGAVSPGGAAVGADLGGSSKYSNENFEGRRGERFHVNGTCTWPEVGSSGRKSTARRVVSGAPPAALENPEDRVPSAPGRTHNRIRVSKVNSLWSMEQCRQGKSAKWIRNLGKRIGSEGWARGSQSRTRRLPVQLLELLPRRERVAACRPGGRTGNGSFGGLPRATTVDSELVRDKGNPTV
ncbi:hypothetical protein V6N13_024447 [Hibiscus sabdariffa]